MRRAGPGSSLGAPPAASPAPCARSPPAGGVGGPQPGAGARGAAPQGHATRTPARPPKAHRLLPKAALSGGGVGMGWGTASGGPGRTTALAASSPAAAAPRDTSPISAGSRRCRATVRPPKAPVLPADPARAFRARNVPVPGVCGRRVQRACPPLSLSPHCPCPPPSPCPPSTLVLPTQHPWPPSSPPAVSPTPLSSSPPPSHSCQTSPIPHFLIWGTQWTWLLRDPNLTLLSPSQGERTPKPYVGFQKKPPPQLRTGPVQQRSLQRGNPRSPPGPSGPAQKLQTSGLVVRGVPSPSCSRQGYP